MTNRPTWHEHSARVRSRAVSAAIAVLEVDPEGPVLRDASRWLEYESCRHGGEDCACRRRPALDWEGWARDVDAQGRGWSSGEFRLFEIAAGLGAGRPFRITDTLDALSQWEPRIWQILVTWGTGGDSREQPGRMTTQTLSPVVPPWWPTAAQSS